MIVDTNVVISLIDDDDDDVLPIVKKMAAEANCFINEIIFAEFAGRYGSTDAAMWQIARFDLSIERLTLDECHRAGIAFREYRRRGGMRTSILPDFLIGAQASMRGWPILTADRKGFASYFPEVTLIEPKL